MSETPRSSWETIPINRNWRCIRLALDQAYRSRQKQRARTVPSVGAVLRDARGQTTTAFRSERRRNSHAEFILFEKLKLHATPLVGPTLYTTLEPCIDVRSPKKTDCAVRIVKRGIEHVVIGMLDPDPRVTGKGVLYLREHGVRVERFPPSGEQELRRLDSSFIESRLFQGYPQRHRPRHAYVIAFVDDINPDPVATLLAARQAGESSILNNTWIRWSPQADSLWRRILEDRCELVQELRLGSEPFQPNQLFSPLEIADAGINFAHKVRTYARRRIPLMYRGMSRYWNGRLKIEFSHTLRNFLRLCSAEMLMALWPRQRSSRPDIFPKGSIWYWWSKGRLCQEIFQSEEPFLTIRPLRLGRTEFTDWLYAPHTDVLRCWKDIEKKDCTEGGIAYSRYIVPQVEFNLLGSARVVNYGPMVWKAILDAAGFEIRPGSWRR